MSDWVDCNDVLIETPPDGAVGFIYVITRIDSGRQYIGKKLLKFAKTKVVKGKKKRLQVESDWKEYYGSNSELQEEVKIFGSDKFKRQIIKFCYSKTECNYVETEEIFKRNALKSDNFYNSWVTCKITKKHVKSAQLKNKF